MKTNFKKIVLFKYGDKEYGKPDVLIALKKVGVISGDNLFVHSDLESFGKLAYKIRREELLGGFLEALKGAVGEKGTIIMPAFSYSYCKGEIFDPEKTPSTVGVLTEYFRTQPSVLRSSDAIFSVAALGPDAAHFINVGKNCFGPGSIFEKLQDKNVKIVFLGETFDMTYMHFIEQHCHSPYRFLKRFEGKTLVNGKEVCNFFDYNVRPLDGSVEYNLLKIEDFFRRRGVIKEAKLGYSAIRLVTAKDAFLELSKGLKNNPNLLLKHKIDNTETRIRPLVM